MNVSYYATPFVGSFPALNCSRYLFTLPSIQIGNENLKLGYEIAQLLLNTPSMAS